MDWPDSFYALKRGEGCPMCEQGRPEETEYGARIFAGDVSDAYLQKAAIQRGYSVVIWRGRHIAEPTELTDDEACAYWLEVLQVGRAVEQHFEPVKLNYDLLGNSLPHLHTHVMPRYADDPRPGWPFPFPDDDPSRHPEPQLQSDVEALRALLGLATSLGSGFSDSSSPQARSVASPMRSGRARLTLASDAGMTAESKPGVDLYWLPLGAGGHSVRLNGRVFEAVAARLERRPPCDLYHSALEVRVPEGRFVIEMTPIPDGNGRGRGVVAEGAVGSRWAGRFRIFRYEVRRWFGGLIPDVDEAVESPQRLTEDPALAQLVLDLIAQVPTPVWGRDELRAGEMWNSNSLIAWLLARCGLSAESITAPAGGRAPGWRSGLAVARREATKGRELRTKPLIAH